MPCRHLGAQGKPTGKRQAKPLKLHLIGATGVEGTDVASIGYVDPPRDFSVAFNDFNFL
jgi:hypothetical protein